MGNCVLHVRIEIIVLCKNFGHFWTTDIRLILRFLLLSGLLQRCIFARRVVEMGMLIWGTVELYTLWIFILIIWCIIAIGPKIAKFTILATWFTAWIYVNVKFVECVLVCVLLDLVID